MAHFTLTPSPWQTFFRDDGTPVADGQLYTYQAGLTTPATTYRTSSGTPQSNPIILDGAGRATIYLAPGSTYGYILYDSAASGGALIRSQDNVEATTIASSDVNVDGIFGETVLAGQVVYLSDGSGSKVAGRWYLAKADNAYSSTQPEIGVAPDDGITGVSGTIRLLGKITGVTVTVGLSYYVSAATAGSITSTPPVLARFVGQADSGTSLVVSPDPPFLAAVDNSTCDARLSLTTALPVTVADVTAATAIFVALYKGNRISLYDGTRWNVRTFTQLTVAVPSTTNSIYDVFVYDNAGTPTIELSIAWTSDTAIFASGIYASLRPTQDGVPVKSTNGTLIDATRRYIGSFRTTGVSGQTEDSFVKRYVWNYYNRVRRGMRVTEPANSWTNGSASFVQLNSSTANQIDLVVGVSEALLDVRVQVFFTVSAEVAAGISIGEDVTNAQATGVVGATQIGLASAGTAMNVGTASLTKYPAIGRHFYPALEFGSGGATVTFYGDNNAPTRTQSGIFGWIDG